MVCNDMVNDLLTQMPVITDLRNPTLKQRHWDVIEDVLNCHFSPEEPLTLGRLVHINAFRHAERLQEISGQASSEASLEGILKKVSFHAKETDMNACFGFQMCPVIYDDDYDDDIKVTYGINMRI